MFGVTPRQIICGAWLLFGLYWLLAALGTKKTAKKENLSGRFAFLLLMVAGFFLLYQHNPDFGALNRRFLPDDLWMAWVGGWLTAAGVLFAIWARRTIGRDWSGDVQIKQGHELIRSGPYARIRHPIYTGILLAVIGTALAIGEYRALVAFGFFLIGFTRKAKKEEAFLAAEFGAAFEEHRLRTGFYLPRLF